MEFFEVIYLLIYLVNILTAAVVIFIERRNISTTWAWLFVLVFLPVLGFFLYIIIGQNLSRLKLYKLKGRDVSLIQELREEQKRKIKTREIYFKDLAVERYTDLIYLNLTSSNATFTQDNCVKIFTDGQSKFAALLDSIQQAKDHIHLLYYILRNDELGRKIVQALIAKAKEGVKVKVLYDDVGSPRLDRKLLRPLKEAGGEIAAFFPSKIPYVNIRLNYRNHRKIVIIDGKVGYIGGYNIGNEYLGTNKQIGSWRDTHLKITGSAVQSLQAQFCLDWNLSSASQLTFCHSNFPSLDIQGDVGLQIVSSGPNSELQQIKDAYLKMIYTARESIYLQTPYFVPDEGFLTALKIAAMSGVDVRIMIPQKADHRFITWASSSYLGELLKSGVKCYLYKTGFLHAKTIVVDNKIASVGTANIDIRSFKLNFEINAFIYDTRTSYLLKNSFVKDIDNCFELTWETYHNRPMRLRLMESLIRLLSPLF